VSPEPIDLSRLNIGNEDMPIVIGAVNDGIQLDDPRRLGVGRLIKEEQLEMCGIARVETEIDPAVRDGRAKGSAGALRLQA
jgi:hypothetical protein